MKNIFSNPYMCRTKRSRNMGTLLAFCASYIRNEYGEALIRSIFAKTKKTKFPCRQYVS